MTADTPAQPLSAEEIAGGHLPLNGDVDAIAKHLQEDDTAYEDEKEAKEQAWRIVKALHKAGYRIEHTASMFAREDAATAAIRAKDAEIAVLAGALTIVIELSDQQDSEDGVDSDEHDAAISMAKDVLADIPTAAKALLEEHERVKEELESMQVKLEHVEAVRDSFIEDWNRAENAEIAATQRATAAEQALKDACAREREHLSAVKHANAGRMEWFNKATTAEQELASACKRVKVLEKMDQEAGTYVESVICMRTNFTGDHPYVGWKGLGLALNEALDERDKLREARPAQGEAR